MKHQISSIAIASLLAAQPALVAAQASADSTEVKSPTARTLTGRILSTDGSPIEGVIVSVPGRGVSTTTDADGRYSLRTKATQGTLKVVAGDYYGHEYPLDEQVIPSVIVLVPTSERNYSGAVVTPSGTQDRDAASAIVETLYKKDMKSSNSAGRCGRPPGDAQKRYAG
jgi:hypothetical protein